jgi:ectoine hydroxylase-related dioxygenase (phytanoyl-CoA dioxygenase family)
MSYLPLGNRFEFLSREWIEAATGYLRTLVEQRKVDLKEVDFTLAEVFEQAPPHLGWDGNLAAWNVRIHDGQVTVAPGLTDKADCNVSGIYQLALPAVQAIGGSAMGRAIREAQFTAGRPVYLMQGQIPDILAPVFQELHDFLARRTTQNPNHSHRVAQYGLADKIREVEERGYTVLERVISPELVAELRAAVQEECEAQSSLYTMGLLGRGRLYEEIVQHPQLLTLMEGCLGPGMILGGVTGSMKGPGPSVVPLHTDYTFIPAPFPEFCTNGVAVWALDDWSSEASGPTMMMPGSHKLRRPPEPGVDVKKDGVPVIMPAGSVVWFAYGVWHWAADRTEPGRRVTLHNLYSRPFIRPHDSFTHIEPGILNRNSPILSGLVGADDHLEKSGYYGHDIERASYTESLLGWGKQNGGSDERFGRSAELGAHKSADERVR